VLETPGRYLAELTEGARLVFADAELRLLVLLSWVIVGASIGTEALAVPYAHAHHQGGATAGLLTAVLPLGTVLGAVFVARVLPTSWAEPLMLPMAVGAAGLLSLTGFNLRPLYTGVLWFFAGTMSSMVVTANRVFVAKVPKPARSRAFGIAVAGLNGWQGLGTLLAGALAARVGPATSTADLALPALALVVVLGVSSDDFRSRARPPMSAVGLDQGEARSGEDVMMSAAPRRPELRVWLLSAVLTVLTLAVLPALRGHHAYVDAHIPVWWLLALFCLGLAYPMVFKYRQQSWAVSLETVPLVLGLLFLSPAELLGTYAAAIVVCGLIRRQALIRTTINTAGRCVAVVAAIGVFTLLKSSHGGVHSTIWPALFTAVLTHELVSAGLVATVLSITDATWRLRTSLRVLAVSVPVVVVAAFLAICTAAAVTYDRSTMWAITVFVVLTVTGMQTYHRLSERATALDRLNTVAREMGPLAGGAKDLGPALTQLRRIISAYSMELMVNSGPDPSFGTVVTATDDESGVDHVSVSDRMLDEEAVALMPAGRAELRLPWLPRPSQRNRRSDEQISAPLTAGGRTIGWLRAAGNSQAFEAADVRLLEAAADQIGAALEKGRLVDSLRRAAERDSLTELANLDSLRLFLSTMLDATAGGVLLLFDIDRFHEVNDMLGHDAGDAVLVEVARRLESSPSQGALAARVGSDQFALAIPGAAGGEVARLAALAVKSRVDGSLRFSEVSADVRVTVGIARAPEHGNDAATLLRRAEMAMTAAKGTSSAIGEWEPSYERDGSRRLQLLTGLRQALAEGSLRVEYQPKIKLGSGEVVGFEALVRWRHPELGPVSPAEFVPLAEATGLISALTSVVMRTALNTCRSWHDAGKRCGIAVNISARGLDDPVLVGEVAAMLTATGLDPHWLTLEVTESSVMENPERSLDVLRQLRMLGVRLSIDDFGTGYSSLHQLRGLPVHEVKIDRSFVETVDGDGVDKAVVHAVVQLCDSLGLVAVAEGVETASQAYALETLGVTQVQGFFHGRPMAAGAAMDWLAPRRVAVPSALSDSPR
jgi:diguanylate cyclase (GGDEF)-like protein